MSMAPRKEYDGRVQRARTLMRERDVDGLIVTDPISYFYFSGHRSPPWMRLRPSIFVLPLEGDPAIISWSGPEMFARVYNRPFPSWVEDKRIYPEVPFTEEPVVDWGLRELLSDRGLDKGRVAIELGQETTLGIPVNDFFALQTALPGVEFVENGPIVWGCRMIKSNWEIDCSRKACDIGGRAWKAVMESLEPGVSAREIQTRIIRQYQNLGADIDSGPPMTLGASGEDGTFQKGDILYLDGGPTYMGYGMDFTRRACFGQPSERQLDEHNGMWEILFKVMDRMKPGITMAEIFEYSQSLMATRPDWRNYSDHPAKRIGHGMGLGSEPPSMNGYDHRPLQAGMVLTPEPKMESADGLVNPEEHVVMTGDGYEQLSNVPGWELHVID